MPHGALCKRERLNECLQHHWRCTTPKPFADAVVHAFVLCLTTMGLKFTDRPKSQHAARAATVQQSKSLRLPPLVPQFVSKLVVMYHDKVQVWPLQQIDSSQLKLLHEFDFGGTVNAKQLLSDEALKQRLNSELAVWDVSLSLDEFSAFEFNLNKVKVLGFNGILKNLQRGLVLSTTLWILSWPCRQCLQKRSRSMQL